MTFDLYGLERLELGRGVWVAWLSIPAFRRQEPSGIDVRPGWLHPAEWLEAEVLANRDRRWQWLAGRRATRFALKACVPGCLPCEIRILSRDQTGRNRPPGLWLGSTPARLSLSIAHDDDFAVAAIGFGAVGVDVAPTAGQGVESARRWAAAEAGFKLSAGRPGERFIRWPHGDNGQNGISNPEDGAGVGAYVFLPNKVIAVCTADEEAA